MKMNLKIHHNRSLQIINETTTVKRINSTMKMKQLVIVFIRVSTKLKNKWINTSQYFIQINNKKKRVNSNKKKYSNPLQMLKYNYVDCVLWLTQQYFVFSPFSILSIPLVLFKSFYICSSSPLTATDLKEVKAKTPKQ